MANAEKPESSQRPPNSSADEAARDRLEKYSKILQDFVASNDEVYEFEGNLPGKDRAVAHELCRKMGLGFKWIGPRISGRQKVSVHKIKEKVSDQAVMPKKRKRKEGPESHQRQNLTIDVSSRIRISKILENFLASKDKVYTFGAYLSNEEHVVVHQLSRKMGFKCRFSGLGEKREIYVYKSKKQVGTATLLESLNNFTYSEGSNQKRWKKEKPESQHLNPTVESTMIRVSQILDNFVVSKDEVYKFEANLSPEELAVVQQLSRKMGFKVKKSGKQKISVHKIKRKVGTTTELESLSHFTFSEVSKQVLGGLLMHYPPGDEEFLGEMIGTNTDTTDKANQKSDDFFGRPCMSKADVAMKLEELAARMQNPSDLKPIVDKRSKLPIVSFKDVIASSVDSHQVVLISGETGCGKTTQVPQFILDHMWGKGEVCKIVCTQPRRISAISVSERISCERGQTIGNDVGYKIRLESKGGRQSSIVLCTTGVLLKVLVSRGYSQLKTQAVKGDISGITHIIMDEIHERDRYSDIMLTILREMLPSYPHLRLILMSATVDAERFCQYFGNCPVIHVPGFTYPVKNFYLEDVLSMVKWQDNHHDNNHKLSQEEKLALDEAINLAWSNDEWYPLLELVYSEGGSRVFNHQHSLTGFTPLMIAAGKGKVGDMSMLLSLGVDIHLRAKDGKTALEIADKENQQVAAEVLRKHMRNDSSDKEGKNLLNKYLATVNPELVDVVLIEQLIKQICTDSEDGGILVFFPGWDEINRTRVRLLASPFFNDTERFMIISLHSKVPSLEQKKVFMHPPHGCRKIVLSTNIAETAVTIDDIVYVIDTGRMKEKSYDPYHNVLTLQSSWVSKASAKQREGRAGRCQPGICYHLYSTVRAASLPDFRVPEIKRMPVEEICLEIKMLDPSCKIEEFLSKTLDPPVLESIQNGIAVLQELGALTLDEELTQLGQKLGSLPVHPSTSRMLLLAILMNCLGPALTLACASELKDPFTLPVSPEEKMRAQGARSELASLYGACGDQFAVFAAFECWRNSKNMGLEAQFCSKYFVSPGTMSRLSGMRNKLAAELFRNGLICHDVSNYCLNANDPGILHAVLVAGMYPRVGKLRLPSKSGKSIIVETESGDKVGLSNRSTNFQLSSKKSFDRSLVVYDEITRGDWGMTIGNCTVIGPLPLLLISKEIAVAPAKGCKEDDFMSSPDNKVRVIVDRWLCWESTALDVSQIYYLRERLSAAISFKVIHSTDALPPILGATVDALSCILSCDGNSGIPQVSDDADTPTTTACETSSSKMATRTKQIGKNPDRIFVAPRASDGADTPTTTANKTISSKPATGIEQIGKNPDRISAAPPASDGADTLTTTASETKSSKLAMGTKQIRENPQGSHTELINQDACQASPYSNVTISASVANENPSDQTCQIASIDLAISIPTEYMGKKPEGSCTELINHDILLSSRVSTTASEGLENPSDPKSQNVAMGSACSILTMHTATNPEESHAALMGHGTHMADVPSFEVGISASSCIENPNDPTSQNAVIGLG